MGPEDDVDQRREISVAFHCMPKWQIALYFVAVTSTFTAAEQVPGSLEIGYDPLHGAFCNPDTVRYVAHPRFGVCRQAEQNMGVVGQKRPARVPCWFCVS